MAPMSRIGPRPVHAREEIGQGGPRRGAVFEKGAISRQSRLPRSIGSLTAEQVIPGLLRARKLRVRQARIGRITRGVRGKFAG